MRIGQHARHEVGVRVGGEQIVLGFHSADHGAHDMAQERRDAFEFVFGDFRGHDGQLTERQRLGGARTWLRAEQGAFAEELATA